MQGKHTFDTIKNQVKQINEKERNQEVEGDVCRFPALSERTFTLSPASWARLNGLAEYLCCCPETLLEEVVACALGDADDGFLAAFDNENASSEANTCLKNRVKALLQL